MIILPDYSTVSSSIGSRQTSNNYNPHVADIGGLKENWSVFNIPPVLEKNSDFLLHISTFSNIEIQPYNL